MRNFVLVLISLFILSCNDDSLKSEKVQETYTVSNTETLEILLTTAIPVEGGYSVAEQPQHAVLSEVQYQEKGIFYVYKPEKGFTGIDVVKIKREDSNGAEVYAETITTINIKVTE
ncbi:hypothetical protein [Salinimicrobium terrae]|uniref:hypothetical protein n=1 Tax=Salinimicrobium terrae TaxID=470866 RepID=UPI000429EB23|nr:hypothetical protein [Salinimicrobium terrae]